MNEKSTASVVAPVAILAASIAIFYLGRNAGKDDLKPGEIPLTEIEG